MIFHALDTETDNREEGGHAILITTHGPAGGKELLFPKGWAAIWKFLKGKSFVAFNADFDIRALCHDSYLPYTMLRTLGRFKIAQWKGWTFKYVPSKFLTVRKDRESFTIYDLKQFYQGSLGKTAEKHLPDGARKNDIPKSWYPKLFDLLRAGGSRANRVRAYARKDAEVCYLLCERLLSSFRAVGVNPNKLISPASLTMEYFGKQLKDEPAMSDEQNRLWAKGFYGGRVEVGTLGTVENVNLFDIHSAYPAEIAQLTSLGNTQLIEGIKNPLPVDQVAYGLYWIRAFIPIHWHWGPLAVRDGTRVEYPVGEVQTWCGLPGRKTLESLGVKYEIKEFHEFKKAANEKRIFSGIESLYTARKNPVLSLAAKLMLNSLYGKLCESRRERIAVGNGGYRNYRAFGRYTNYVLAAHITESVRMRVFQVLHTFGTKAHVAATDSVLIEGELPTGFNLGEWGLSGRYQRAAILGCGRYFFEGFKADDDKYLLRGFVLSKQIVKKIKTARRPYVRISGLETQSLLQWSNDDGASDLNVLGNERKILRCSDEKRAWDGKFKSMADAFKIKLTSKPWVRGTSKAVLTEILNLYGR